MAEAGLAARVLAGEVRAAARLMREVDDHTAAAEHELRQLYPHTGRARIIGITGNPGAGKSTVVDQLIERYRAAGKKVGVVCIDPTSPFSGGAILGDRIRMQRHATDPGVFIRSLATRGHLGGLSRSTSDIVAVLDAMGMDVVIVETVGVGQDEVEVVSLSHTAVVVTVPGMGDDIQAIKAGILEIADVLVINKADREGADRAERDLIAMLHLRSMDAPEVEIIRTVASSGGGIPELVAAIARFEARATAARVLEARGRARARAQLVELMTAKLLEAAEAALAGQGGLDALAARVAQRTQDPYGAADEVVRALLARGSGPA
ncbi:MAG: methylmalonyl Co-A mutase-associated GTPase MeaB [Deltaproteobacteria bacterium]|nr:methylmalonyl Co-A mutase-associated GTPase MeaB [Deltaproteobacteria bacterium]